MSFFCGWISYLNLTFDILVMGFHGFVWFWSCSCTENPLKIPLIKHKEFSGGTLTLITPPPPPLSLFFSYIMIFIQFMWSLLDDCLYTPSICCFWLIFSSITNSYFACLNYFGINCPKPHIYLASYILIWFLPLCSTSLLRYKLGPNFVLGVLMI